ncbi:rhodanese-related sulfurtransferase [Herbaspirillum sp. Sphag1AN]|uniref:rhodanese homology domain-containing protein n=1 Tax=unclassified Herbaspirillum TaxID=2624150 RepID=UPI0016211E23|nr:MULTISPECIES: rhodanese homology domain-containing protein [unclassified Herbaspirillum]MBB3212633.1 rhodanese-related sulfurtransferase [Herbaspirillum sp. Sphag1AN]MBB3245830.1 rhodanese-related sulfurtransferase [Herbaspirillum sp. Sphag64]
MSATFPSTSIDFAHISYQQVRSALLARHEIALLDVREEAPHAVAHPLFAANLPLSQFELLIYSRVPRRDTTVVVLDDGEGLAEIAAQRLHMLGYSDISILEGGVRGWLAAGGELFQDVNAPSKAFGELVESRSHTPSLSAQEVKALLDANEDLVVLDARRFDEYQNMNIPGSVSVPGAELALRVRTLAPNPKTRVIVNCAGRTRSIIGTQSLVNLGIPNQVHALRNGTIGWTLAGQKLEHGSDRCFPEGTNPETARQAVDDARAVADRAGVLQLSWEHLQVWRQELTRTTYQFDVRTPGEYEAGHISGFLSAPGGQLVQETEANATVRGARIVLVDDDGVRANMTGSWLAQMGWEVAVLDGVDQIHFNETGRARPLLPPVPVSEIVTPETLSRWLQESDATVVLDVSASANYVKQHIPGAWFVLRSQLQQALKQLPWQRVQRYVLTCGSGSLAAYATADLARITDLPVFLLNGGNAAWKAAGLPLESGETRLASPRIDRYRRPYEGTDNPASAMQAYLDWEFGLVEQLGRDGTHGFRVI